MTTPNQASQVQGMMGPDSPIDFEMLMSLRNAARGRQGMQGAASRRMNNRPSSVSPGEESEGGTDPMTGELVNGQTPEEIMLNDMQQQMDAEVEPPELTGAASKLMMRYGTIQEYLMRAKGEMPNG